MLERIRFFYIGTRVTVNSEVIRVPGKLEYRKLPGHPTWPHLLQIFPRRIL
jgi:hypothetical protein